MKFKRALSFGLPLCLLMASNSFQQASAQNGVTTSRRTVIESTTSSGGNGGNGGSEIESQSGVMGVQSANKVNYHYQKTLENYKGQITLLYSNGHLTTAQADDLRAKLSDLQKVEQSVREKNYPKAETDDLEKRVTAFNAALSTASTDKPAPVEKPVPASKPAVSTLSKSKQKKKPTPAHAGKPAASAVSGEPGLITPGQVLGKPLTGADKSKPEYGSIAPSNAGNSSGRASMDMTDSKELPGKKARRPMSGGGDTKPPGAAGKE